MQNGGWTKTIGNWVGMVAISSALVGAAVIIERRLTTLETAVSMTRDSYGETASKLGEAVDALKDRERNDAEQDQRLRQQRRDINMLKGLHGLSWFDDLGDSITLERHKAPVEPGSWVPGGTE